MKKSILIAFLILLTSIIPVFAMSITYKDTPQAYDSPVILSQFDKDKDGLNSADSVKDIYICFYGAGKTFYEMFGHVSIIVRYDNNKEDTYDYGVFNPRSKGFLSNVLHGFMFYELYRQVNRYSLQNEMESAERSIRYYRLKGLAPDKKEDISKFLKYNYSEYRRKYLYHFFNDNCSTRIRDILDKAYDGKLSEIGKRPYGSERTAIETQISPYPLTEMLYGIAGGSVMDREISYYDAMFLPSILEYALDEIGASEFDSKNDWNVKYDYNANFETKTSSWTPLIYIALIFALLNVIFKISFTMKYSKATIRFYALINSIVLLVIFVISLCMCYMQLYTIIDCAWYNENTIFINPLILVPLVEMLMMLFSKTSVKFRTLNKLISYQGIFFTLLALLALLLKPLLPYQANTVQIVSFLVYYLSLIDYYGIYKKITRKHKAK